MADPKPPQSSKSTFLLLISFVVVAFVLFDPTLRDFLGRAVGAVFEPVLGFDGRHPLWTVALGGVIMILASTVVRHFLVDWVKMARVQEVMRHFQKEFRTAQKENNTYKMKRLTEAQPEIMQMQAELSGEQLKPMALTMLVVIPIFIWLSTFMVAPVAYEADYDGSGEALLVAYGDDLWDADVVGPGRATELHLLQNTQVHAFALSPGAGGTVALSGVTNDVAFDARDLPPLPEGRTVRLEAGEHLVRTADNLDVWDVEEPAKLTRALVLVMGEDNATVVAAHVASWTPFTLDLDAPATVRVIVPAAVNAAPRGENPLQVHLGDTRLDFHEEDVVLLATAEGQAFVTPKAIRVPWNDAWDLNVSWWILPHWIILYTLISIPLGTVTQKLLKKWEFQRVDLDRDGVPAGRNP